MHFLFQALRRQSRLPRWQWRRRGVLQGENPDVRTSERDPVPMPSGWHDVQQPDVFAQVQILRRSQRLWWQQWRACELQKWLLSRFGRVQRELVMQWASLKLVDISLQHTFNMSLFLGKSTVSAIMTLAAMSLWKGNMLFKKYSLAEDYFAFFLSMEKASNLQSHTSQKYS